MRFLRTTSTARLAALLIGVAAAAAATAAIALAATSAGGSKPPSEPLAKAVRDAIAAPAVQGVSARVKWVNHLIDSSAVTGSGPLISGADGRLWASTGGKFRLELQSTDGDVQLVANGRSLLLYESQSNTAYRAELPAEQSKPEPHHGVPSLARIQHGIDRARTQATVSRAIPTIVAGHPAYEVQVSPHSGGLLSGARLAWDAARGLPLRLAVFARGDSSPVLSLTATSISYGAVPASTFDISPPPGAKVVDLTPRGGGSGAGAKGSSSKPLSFKLSAPARLGGLARHGVKRFGDGAVVSYGQDLSGLVVIEKKAGGGSGQGGSRRQADLGLSLPSVSINGVTGQELPTALGTMVRFTRGGVDYTVLGAQPASTVIAAARAL
jgi:outer membrane lipoprotein-sorting protein